MVKKLAIFFIFSLYFLKSASMLDPDFGWHIKMGELILNSGIPATDPFSYTMPSFPFVDHEWGTNVSLFLLYQNLGWEVLAFIFSSIALLAVLIPLKFNLKKYSLFPLLLTSGSILFFVGIRPQLITWLFFSTLITIFLEKKYYDKFRFTLPFFFLAWANLHGGFSIGIAVYALFLLIQTYKEMKIKILDVFPFALSIVSTLINPYGIRLWGEVWLQLSDRLLRWNILEWRPAIFSFYPSVWLLFAFLGFFIIMFRRQFSLFEKALYLSLLAAGLSSVRHMALWAIATSVLVLKGVNLLEKKAKKIKYGKQRFEKAYKFSVFMALVFFLIPLLLNIKEPFSLNEKSFYPKQGVTYLSNNPSRGNLFSDYGWGGYLIWKLPSKKVFVDGRMPSWRWKANIPGESNYAFKEYLSLDEKETKFEPLAKKYKIDTIFLHAPSKKQENFDKFLIWLSEKIEGDKSISIHEKLKKEGWRIAYEDKIAVIYRK